jgi:hypothetical protein
MTVTCFPQILQVLPVIGKDDLPDAEFSTARSFNGASLFGYIDGGAELYLEYGFSDAVITEITYKGEKYKTEIFRMNRPEEAFGIFSVSKYKCAEMPDLSLFTCQTKFQLQFCKGPYYVSIINGRGSAADSIVMLEFGKLIAGRIVDPEPDLSEFLPFSSPEDLQKNCFLARGRLGIVNGSPDLEDYFQGITGYTAAVVKRSNETIISVRFDSEDSYKRFLDLHKWESVLFASDEKRLPGGEAARLLSRNHLYIKIEN